MQNIASDIFDCSRKSEENGCSYIAFWFKILFWKCFLKLIKYHTNHYSVMQNKGKGRIGIPRLYLEESIVWYWECEEIYKKWEHFKFKEMFCKYIPLYLKILGVVNIFLLHLRNVPMYLNANYLYTVKKI